MRILFLCGSFEPGRDGVGDYTRRLAEELLRTGHEVAVVAINDNFLEKVQQVMLQGILVLRIPAGISEQERFAQAGQFIKDFDAAWLSLQYVPFSFHPKGLSFSLARNLKQITAGRKWEIMFHEICVGMHMGASVKLRLWGWVQQQLAKSLLRRLQPVMIHTHIAVYQKQLEKFGARAKLLPLFSNIPLSYDGLVKEKLTTKAAPGDLIDILIFASIQEGAPIKQLAEEAKKYKDEKHIDLRLLIIGRSGREQEHWVSTWKAAGLPVLQMGEQPADKISELLAKAVFGIFTTPLILTGKSGAVAAMREHGINLLAVSRSWEPRGITAERNPLHIMEYYKGNLIDFLSSEPDFSILPTVETVAEQFYKDLLKDK